MQQLNAAPRDGLTTAQVTDMLKSAAIEVTAGCELLNPDLSVVQDISDYVANGSVSRIMTPGVEIHGACALTLTTEFDWGGQLFRPYMFIKDANSGLSTQWFLGAYHLTTPETEAESDERVVNGYDRLYLLNRPVGRTYEVAAGANVIAAMYQVIADAGLTGVSIDSTADTKTLPKAMVWPLIPTSVTGDRIATWRNVFNDLAKAIGYNEVWADYIGRFRSEPFVHPSQRAPEFTFDAQDVKTIVGQKRTMVYDTFNIPNKWIFIQQNRPDDAAVPSEGDGIYTVTNQSSGETSIDARGLTWPKVVQFDSVDQAALVIRGTQEVMLDTNVAKQYKLTTGPFPAAGHQDVFTYKDAAWDGLTHKVIATRWEMTLAGDDVSWTWEEVT